MPLSCSCDFDGEGWLYYAPDDYSTMKPLPRRKRCSSCRALIDPGATVAEFERFRQPISEVEEMIFGEDGEIPLARMFLCERCADLYFSFRELGFECVSPDENMMRLAREYAETFGPRPSPSWSAQR